MNRAVILAWQGALAAEHRTYFGYGVLGPHCTGAALDLARTCADAHQALRFATAAAITAVGAAPVPPQPDYPDLYSVTDERSAARLAVTLEDGCAETWRYLYATAAATASGRPARDPAQRALTASAVRAVRWRRTAGAAQLTEPFPGIAPSS